MVLKKKK